MLLLPTTLLFATCTSAAPFAMDIGIPSHSHGDSSCNGSIRCKLRLQGLGIFESDNWRIVTPYGSGGGGALASLTIVSIAIGITACLWFFARGLYTQWRRGRIVAPGGCRIKSSPAAEPLFLAGMKDLKDGEMEVDFFDGKNPDYHTDTTTTAATAIVAPSGFVPPYHTRMPTITSPQIRVSIATRPAPGVFIPPYIITTPTTTSEETDIYNVLMELPLPTLRPSFPSPPGTQRTPKSAAEDPELEKTEELRYARKEAGGRGRGVFFGEFAGTPLREVFVEEGRNPENGLRWKRRVVVY